MSGGADAPAGSTADELSPRGAGPRSARRRFGELLALTTFAVGQPLFDLLGKSPAFFVAHRAEPLDLVLFALLPTVGIAAALLGVEAVVGATRRSLVGPLHAIFLALLGTALGLLIAHELPRLPAAVAMVVAAAIGVGIAWLSRTRSGRTFLGVAGLLAALLPLHFLLLTPVRRLLLPAGGAASAGAVGGHAGGGDQEAGAIVLRKPIPVVLLVFDELPLSSLLDSRGGIAARRFPNFAAVAARSTWYRRATSVSAATQLAVPALLTGKYPDPDSLPAYADHPRNLFTALAGSHRVRAFESLTHLCPPAVCTDGGARIAPSARMRSLFHDASVVYLHLVLPPAWTRRLPGIAATWSGFRRAGGSPGAGGDGLRDRGDLDHDARDEASRSGAGADPDGRRRDVPRQVAAFLAEVQHGVGEERPGLYYLHLELPHIPWRYLPNGHEYGPISASFFADGVNDDSTWRDDDWLLAQGAQRHLLQLAYADRVLGELLAGLEAHGLLERALLVVTADHGIAFVAGEPGRRVTPTNYAEVLSVPLLVARPGQRTGTVSDLPARTIDLLPTILAAQEAEAPWRLDGRSALLSTSNDELAQRDDVVVVDGGLRRFPLAAVPAAERRAVERLAGWFGDDRSAAELLALSRRPELIGHPLASLPTVPQPGAGVALEQPWFLDRVDPGSGFVPARIVGRLLPLAGAASIADQTDLAVAVNGVVRATTRSFRDGAAVRFGALVPEESFVPGRNVVEVFLVPAGAEAPLVPTVDRSGPRYRLRRRAGGEVTGIDATNGTSCTLDPGAVAGGLVPEDWYVAGWAQPQGDRPFAVIMVFVGDELTHVVATGGEPPAGSRAAGVPGRERTGFRFTIPESLRGGAADRADTDLLRVFAVAGERCTELRFEKTAGAEPALRDRRRP